MRVEMFKKLAFLSRGQLIIDQARQGHPTAKGRRERKRIVSRLIDVHLTYKVGDALFCIHATGSANGFPDTGRAH